MNGDLLRKYFCDSWRWGQDCCFCCRIVLEKRSASLNDRTDKRNGEYRKKERVLDHGSSSTIYFAPHYPRADCFQAFSEEHSHLLPERPVN